MPVKKLGSKLAQGYARFKRSKSKRRRQTPRRMP